MNEGMSARVVNEPPSVRVPATGADETIPQRSVGCIGRSCAAHAVKSRDSLTIDGELREDGDADLMTWKTPETTAFPSREFLPAGHDVILPDTPSCITGDTTGGWIAVAIGGMGERAVWVVQPRSI